MTPTRTPTGPNTSRRATYRLGVWCYTCHGPRTFVHDATNGTRSGAAPSAEAWNWTGMGTWRAACGWSIQPTPQPASSGIGGSRMRGIQTKPEPYCPECGARMVLRKPQPHKWKFEPFWGCSQYPGCRGTRQIQENGKPEADDDDDLEGYRNTPW